MAKVIEVQHVSPINQRTHHTALQNLIDNLLLLASQDGLFGQVTDIHVALDHRQKIKMLVFDFL